MGWSTPRVDQPDMVVEVSPPLVSTSMSPLSRPMNMQPMSGAMAAASSGSSSAASSLLHRRRDLAVLCRRRQHHLDHVDALDESVGKRFLFAFGKL